MAHIGTRIKTKRKQRNLTQQGLARAAGINQSFISKLEQGEQRSPNADVLKRLARALGCTTDYLVGMDEEDEDPADVPLLAIA